MATENKFIKFDEECQNIFSRYIQLTGLSKEDMIYFLGTLSKGDHEIEEKLRGLMEVCAKSGALFTLENPDRVHLIDQKDSTELDLDKLPNYIG